MAEPVWTTPSCWTRPYKTRKARAHEVASRSSAKLPSDLACATRGQIVSADFYILYHANQRSAVHLPGSGAWNLRNHRDCPRKVERA